MSEYGFRKIRPEIHLHAAHRNTLNPASGPNSDTLEQQTVAILTSGCVSAGAAGKRLTIDRPSRQTSGF